MSDDTTHDELEREIDRPRRSCSEIDENGEFVHTEAEKWEIAERLARLEARAEEWR